MSASGAGSDRPITRFIPYENQEIKLLYCHGKKNIVYKNKQFQRDTNDTNKTIITVADINRSLTSSGILFLREGLKDSDDLKKNLRELITFKSNKSSGSEEKELEGKEDVIEKIIKQTITIEKLWIRSSLDTILRNKPGILFDDTSGSYEPIGNSLDYEKKKIEKINNILELGISEKISDQSDINILKEINILKYIYDNNKDEYETKLNEFIEKNYDIIKEKLGFGIRTYRAKNLTDETDTLKKNLSKITIHLDLSEVCIKDIEYILSTEYVKKKYYLQFKSGIRNIDDEVLEKTKEKCNIDNIVDHKIFPPKDVFDAEYRNKFIDLKEFLDKYKETDPTYEIIICFMCQNEKSVENKSKKLIKLYRQDSGKLQTRLMNKYYNKYLNIRNNK